jgi:hypothetical protein
VEFASIVHELESATLRSDLRVRKIASPGGIAPFSIAFAAEVLPLDEGGSSSHGAGRFIFLFDPEGQDSWGGTQRIVCFAQAPLEGEISTDALLTDVTWSWLTDALASHDANYTHASGTATRVLAKGFGELAGAQDSAHIELRASWSPDSSTISGHLRAWGELLSMLAGLPPEDGAISMDARRRERG